MTEQHTEVVDEVVVTNNDTPETPPKKKRNRWIKVVAALIVAPILLFAIIVGLVQSERGTVILTTTVKGLTGGNVDVDWSSGSLAHGGAANSVKVNLSGTQIEIKNLSGVWRWDYVPLKWYVANLSAEEVNVTLIPTPDTNKPVSDILMPFAIAGEHIQVGTLNIISGTSTTTMTNINGAVSTDKRHHAISLSSMSQGTADFNGEVKIDGVRPFAIDGQIQAISNFEEQQYQLNLTAQGDFNRLNLGLKANGGAPEEPLKGTGEISLQLLEQFYIHQGEVNITHLNPYVFWNKLLKANLDLTLNATPEQALGTNEQTQQQPVNGSLKIINHAPAPLSELSLPISQVAANFALTPQTQNLSDIEILLSNNGRIVGGGGWQGDKGLFKLDISGFDLKNIQPKLLSTQLGGTLNIDLTKTDQHFVTTLKNSGNNKLELFADVNVNSELVKINQARIAGMGDAKIELQGELAYTEGLPFKAKAQLLQFNLADLGDFPSSRLVGQFDIDGVSTPNAIVNVKGNLNDSSWAGVPAKGIVDVSFNAPDTITARNLDVTIGANHIDAKGALGVSALTQNHLIINVNAPNLAQLQFGFGGSLIGKADLTGSLTKPRGKVDATASALKFGEQSVQSARINGTWESGAQGALAGTVEVDRYLNGLIKIDTLKLDAKGTQASHQFNANMVGNITIQEGEPAKTVNGVLIPATPPVQWILDAQTNGNGHMTDDGWKGAFNQLINRGQPNVTAQQPFQVEWDQGELKLSDLVARVQDAQLNIDTFNMLGARINSRGRVSNLVIPQWLTWLKINLPSNISTDMAIKGQWDLTMGNSPAGGFSFERERGDLWTDKRQKNSIGLSNMSLRGTLAGRSMNIAGALRSDRLGQVDISGRVGLVGSDAGWVISGLSPLDLSAKAEFNKLDQFNSLFGPNIKLQGQIQANMQITGVLSDPIMNGLLTGQNLDLLHVDQGFRLKDGVMRLKLADSSVTFEQFDFNGVEGTLSVRGQASYGSSRLLTAQVTMDKLRPFVRVDRQLVLSGQAELGYDGGNQLSIKGRVRADKALIDMPPTLPPSLGDDVVVCSSDPNKSRRCNLNMADSNSEARVQRIGLIPTIDLTLDLGRDFRFKGQGADVKLVGSVNLSSVEGSPLRTTGVVRVDSGTYKFYGQTLTVERGIVTFQGPLDDPALNVFATRTIDTVEVGVELTGTLADSKARLISTPEMPDEEKLSWLLFGRSASTLSTTDGSAIAGAAAILLGTDQGRKLSEKLGIDSFNFGSSDNGLTGTVVGLGRRLNDQFMVSYEQTLTDVAGVVKLTWTLSRNWQIVLRGGSINGADIQYTKRFDRLGSRSTPRQK